MDIFNLLRFAKDSWLFVDNKQNGSFMFFLLVFCFPILAHLALGFMISNSFIYFSVDMTTIRAFIVCLLVASIPYLAYYYHLKNKGQ